MVSVVSEERSDKVEVASSLWASSGCETKSAARWQSRLQSANVVVEERDPQPASAQRLPSHVTNRKPRLPQLFRQWNGFVPFPRQCGLVVVRGVFCPSFRRNLYPMTTITSPATWDRSERRTATDSEDSVSRFTGSQTAGPAVAVGPAETGFERVSVSLEETLPG